MDHLNEFLASLMEGEHKVTDSTLRNYKADIRQFIEWFEGSAGRSFSPNDVTAGHVMYYFKTKDIAKASRARHLSSLRRFFYYLELKGQLDTKKFPSLIHEKQEDSEDIKAFTIHLYYKKASQLTVKQYRIDVNQFLHFVKKKLGVSSAHALKEHIEELNSHIVSSYMSYLLTNQGYSVSTVTRKKAAINTYLDWLVNETENSPNRQT